VLASLAKITVQDGSRHVAGRRERLKVVRRWSPSQPAPRQQLYPAVLQRELSSALGYSKTFPSGVRTARVCVTRHIGQGSSSYFVTGFKVSG
jgi:hypothetical protein